MTQEKDLTSSLRDFWNLSQESIVDENQIISSAAQVLAQANRAKVGVTDQEKREIDVSVTQVTNFLQKKLKT